MSDALRMSDGDAVELLGACRDRTRVYAAARERQEQTRDAADGVRAQFAERFALYRTALASAALADPAFGQPASGAAAASSSSSSRASGVAAWASRLIGEATSSSSTAADELLGPRAAETRGACARCGTAFSWRVAARECPCCGACYCPRCYGTATTRVVLDCASTNSGTSSSGSTGGEEEGGSARVVEVRVCAACAAAVGRTQARAAFAARRQRAEHDPLALLCCDVTTYMDMADRRIARVETLVPRVRAAGTPEFREAQETLDAARGLVTRIQGALAAVAQMARSTPSHTRLRVLANFKAFTLQYLQAAATPRLVRLQNALVQAAKNPSASSAPTSQQQHQQQQQAQQQAQPQQQQVRMPRPEITAVVPAVVPLGGGAVCVVGTHFHERCTVTVGGRGCAVTGRRALAGAAQELHIVAPPAPAGQQVVAVRVVNPNGDTASMGGLLYVTDDMLAATGTATGTAAAAPRPQQKQQPPQQQARAVRQPRLVLDGVVPAVCALRGGDVRLLGSGFQAGMQVLLDRTPLADVVVLPEGTEALLAVPPMRHSGVHDLTARNPDGATATLKGVLYTLADVSACPSTAPLPRRTAPPSASASASLTPQPQRASTAATAVTGAGPAPLGPAVLVDHFEASNPHSRKWG